MQRFLGVFASDHRHLACAVARSWPGFLPGAPGFRGRMGLGTYGGDEILLMRRPVGPDVRGDTWIPPAPGNLALFALDDSPQARFRPDTTAPWRYRNLLGVFALETPPDAGFADRLLSMVPDFLAKESREDPVEALGFRLFLSVLNDMGRLDARTVPSELLGEALRTVIRLWPRLGAAEGGVLPGLAACVTDGRSLVAGGAGLSVLVDESDGIPECTRCSEPSRSKEHDPIRVSHDEVRVVAITGGEIGPPDPRWHPLADGAVGVVDETGAFRVRSPAG